MGCVTGFIWTLSGFIYSEYDEQLERCLDPWTLEKASSVQWLFVMQLVLSFPFSCSLFYCYFQITAERNIHQQNHLFSRNCIFNAVECNGKAKTCLDFLYCRSFLPLMLSAIFGVWTLHCFSTYQAILDNYEYFYKVYRVVGFIMYANSCFNPFLYGFQSSNYRKNFIRLFTRKTIGNIRQNSATFADATFHSHSSMNATIMKLN